VKHYIVTWVIDIEAETPEEAAEKALEIQRDPESTATVFDVAWDVRTNHGRGIVSGHREHRTIDTDKEST
jgi:hypothetical protein